MSKMQSALGGFLKGVLLRARGRPKGLRSELHGWSEIDFDLPSLHDVEEMYRKSVHLTKGVPHEFLPPIAMGVEGFRGHVEFEMEGNAYCGFHFFRNEASFLLVFRINPRRSVKLYYMGRSADPGIESRVAQSKPDVEFKAACSRLVLNFDMLLQQFYFRFQANFRKEPTAP